MNSLNTKPIYMDLLYLEFVIHKIHGIIFLVDSPEAGWQYSSSLHASPLFALFRFSMFHNLDPRLIGLCIPVVVFLGYSSLL